MNQNSSKESTSSWPITNNKLKKREEIILSSLNFTQDRDRSSEDIFQKQRQPQLIIKNSLNPCTNNHREQLIAQIQRTKILIQQYKEQLIELDEKNKQKHQKLTMINAEKNAECKKLIKLQCQLENQEQDLKQIQQQQNKLRINQNSYQNVIKSSQINELINQKKVHILSLKSQLQIQNNLVTKLNKIKSKIYQHLQQTNLLYQSTNFIYLNSLRRYTKIKILKSIPNYYQLKDQYLPAFNKYFHN